MIARLSLGRRLQGKVDPSDLVQQTLLKAHQAIDRWRGTGPGEQVAWLRRVLARTLADEVRRYQRGKRDAGRELSLLAELDESSIRLEAWLADDQTSPSELAIRHEPEKRQALHTRRGRVIPLSSANHPRSSDHGHRPQIVSRSVRDPLVSLRDAVRAPRVLAR
jgi:RNA polymerase sigma-70 factor (ECF subfamily)